MPFFDKSAQVSIPAPKLVWGPCPIHGGYIVEFTAIFWGVNPDDGVDGEFLGEIRTPQSVN
jgi:hypothetical protein